jgi:thymidylate synthase
LVDARRGWAVKAMFIAADTLDDLLRRVTAKVLAKGQRVETATRGANTELFGVLLQLNKPRARISRTEKRRALFSCLGEFLWYLSKKNELAFISYYTDRYLKESEDGETVRTGYGPRLFSNNGHDQVDNIIATLKKKPESRRAVMQIFESGDGAGNQKEAPCTCTIQLAIRSNKLHMMTFMRSNDIYYGLPTDVFAFTMLQEVVARTLGVGLGKYRHAVGSLHLYDERRDDAKKMLKEGWQEDVPMPHMPKGDPWPSLQKLLFVEAQLREEQEVDIENLSLEPYWKDLARLLQVYRLFRGQKNDEIAKVKKLMSVDIYNSYIEQKRKATAKSRKAPSPKQLSLLARNS